MSEELAPLSESEQVEYEAIRNEISEGHTRFKGPWRDYYGNNPRKQERFKELGFRAEQTKNAPPSRELTADAGRTLRDAMYDKYGKPRPEYWLTNGTDSYDKVVGQPNQQQRTDGRDERGRFTAPPPTLADTAEIIGCTVDEVADMRDTFAACEAAIGPAEAAQWIEAWDAMSPQAQQALARLLSRPQERDRIGRNLRSQHLEEAENMIRAAAGEPRLRKVLEARLGWTLV